MTFNPRTLSHKSQRRAAAAHGSFVTNGASNPTLFGGVITGVLRLVDGGAVPFFRVAFDRQYLINEQNASIQMSVKSADPVGTDNVVEQGDMVASPALVRLDNEIDVLLKDGGIPVDTTGNRINLSAFFSY